MVLSNSTTRNLCHNNLPRQRDNQNTISSTFAEVISIVPTLERRLINDFAFGDLTLNFELHCPIMTSLYVPNVAYRLLYYIREGNLVKYIRVYGTKIAFMGYEIKSLL